MKAQKWLTGGILWLLPFFLSGQSGVIRGRVFNAINNDPVPFATVLVQGTTQGSTTDTAGNYEITGLKPGLYNLEASFLGFETQVIYEIQVNAARASFANIPMREESRKLEAFEVKPSSFNTSEESPVSLRTIGSSEIERNPGGNRDISKVIQSLPGVSSTPSFRNDIIIRGGAPNENRFYLDGIEVPNINHFSTQGASGGPVGMINVNFIREVEFYSGAFPADRGNALSSVLEFRQREGNSESLKTTFTLGSSDVGLTFDGPLGKQTTFLFSARRSYLQLLFAALQLPFLPTYNDFQFKTKTAIGPRDQLILLGLGAIDQFELNEAVNEGVTDEEVLERNEYVLDNIPRNEQWNYTVGANYRHFRENGYLTFIASRNHLNNQAVKYFNNDESAPGNLLLDYSSEEIENKLRLENTTNINGFRFSFGLGYEYAVYLNSTYRRLVTPTGVSSIDYDSRLNFGKYALFGQVSRKLLRNKVTISAGLRSDINDYSAAMADPLDQLSPRLSLSYAFSPKWSLNTSMGRYYQLPPYTVLGYRNGGGELVNKANGIRYIAANHYVGGISYQPAVNAKFTVEAFYKVYDHYPLLLNDSVSLANLGGDFGVIGDEPAAPLSEGRSYGVEFLFQQKLSKGFYGIVAYTLVKSEFTDKTGTYVPSAWDNGHIVNLTAGKKLKKNWEVGFKWRYSGPAPYTPYDVNRSSLIENWDVRGQGIRDYDQINSRRTSATHTLDIRIDKRYYFKNWTFNAYLDVQNIYNYETETGKLLLLDRDENGDPQIDPDRPEAYRTKLITDVTGSVLPSIGIIIEF